MEDDQRIEESPSITLKNSLEGENSFMAAKDRQVTLDNTATHEFNPDKSVGKLEPKRMLKKKKTDSDDDDIQDLPNGDNMQINRGSPFKTSSLT